MNIRKENLEIDNQDPFKTCALKRKQYANILSQIINLNKDGFVLAINNEWGAGKTTFVKMWQRQLQLEKFKTIYFNAWENDFEQKPLIALLAEFKKLAGEDRVVKETMDKLIKKAGIFIKNAFPAATKTLVKKYLGEEYVDTIEGTAKGLSDILADEITEYLDRKEGIKEFRVALTEFTNQYANDRPLIFIIDELDRCRPHYTVELLEQIKHLFTVKNIVFVLAIDKDQLKHAICGVYGSASIDAEQYLRKIFDIEYSIPQPNAELFTPYLIAKYDFNDCYTSSITCTKDGFEEIVSTIFSLRAITLREQEKIISRTKLCCFFFKKRPNYFPSLIFLMIFIKEKNKAFYERIISRKASYNTISSDFSTELKLQNLDINILNNFAFLQALICSIVNNSSYHKSNLIPNPNDSTQFPATGTLSCDREKYRSHLLGTEQIIGKYSMKTSDIIEMIDLLEEMKVETN